MLAAGQGDFDRQLVRWWRLLTLGWFHLGGQAFLEPLHDIEDAPLLHQQDQTAVVNEGSHLYTSILIRYDDKIATGMTTTHQPDPWYAMAP